ncbi:MAG: TetR/AcrR family transcriptional regulator [Sphingomonadaceae bacterium]
MATRAVSSIRASRSQAPQRAESPVRARRYDPAETRTRVLEAAYLLFGTRGYANTGTADIAREADVSEGSIFYHFGSKAGLLVELGRLHGQKMVEAMQGDDPLDSLSFEVTLNRCFDFCEVNNVWEEVVHDGECPPANSLKKNPESEPFFHAAREVVIDWTRRHMAAVGARHGDYKIDTDIAANLIYALVGEALHRYFAPGTTAEERLRIRRECIRFCTAAAGHPAIEPLAPTA